LKTVILKKFWICYTASVLQLLLANPSFVPVLVFIRLTHKDLQTVQMFVSWLSELSWLRP